MDITDALFEWQNWDEVSSEILEFNWCNLKVPIGAFEAGNIVPCIAVDFEHGFLQLLRGDGKLLSEHKVRLALVD